ncbi:MAG: PQQ-binding-like beta-propeller repeat protein [Thermoanaerobaculia bacterium]
MGLRAQRRFRFQAAGMALAAAAAAQPVLSAESSAGPAMFRGDARHRGVYRASAGPALSGVQWKFPTKGPLRGSPVLAGGLVLFGSGDGNLYALEASSGRERWRAKLSGAVQSTPAVSGGLVFATSRGRDVTALDVASGRVAWRFQTGAERPFPWGWDFWLSSPAIEGQRVYVGAGDGNLYALEAATGREIWRLPTEGRVRSSPAVTDGVVYVGSMDGRLYAADAESGKRLWAFDTEGVAIDSKKAGFDRTSVVSSPAVAEGLVYIGSRDARLYAVDRATGRERWRFGHRVDSMEGAPEISWVLGSPALADDLVFVGSSDGHFFNAVRAGTGEEIWRFQTPDNVLSSGALADGQLYFGCEDGHLFALDARTGRERWRFRTGGAVISSPAVADGVVYFGSDDGILYALATGAERPGARTRRAVYWKDVGRQKWFKGDLAVRDYFREEGYELLDDDGLSATLADTAQAPRSVVVVAGDTLPAAATAGAAAQNPLRRYLAAGGRMVWLGLPAGGLELDAKTGRPVRFEPARSTSLLEVAQEAGSFDGMGSTATPEGLRWGLPEWHLSGWAVPREQVSTALAIDEWGLASAWVKSFGGPAGSGFVRLWGREQPIPDLSWVRAVAEHTE